MNGRRYQRPTAAQRGLRRKRICTRRNVGKRITVRRGSSATQPGCAVIEADRRGRGVAYSRRNDHITANGDGSAGGRAGNGDGGRCRAKIIGWIQDVVFYPGTRRAGVVPARTATGTRIEGRRRFAFIGKIPVNPAYFDAG